MKHRSAQSGPRKNPDSSRVHGLRLSVSSSSHQALRRVENPYDPSEASSSPPHEAEVFDLPLTDAADETTDGRERDTGQLLTVTEVATLLRVPVSWVYGRTRKRSSERLPGYRLGKYWRFREDEILAWVKCQCGGHHAA
jgi:excisionase family DNA binding protein